MGDVEARHRRGSASTVGVFEQMRRAKELSMAIATIARRRRITVGQAFRDFDADNSGAITPTEMMDGLRRMGVEEKLKFPLDWPTVVGLVESFDLDHDGVLTEQDWRDYFRALRRELEDGHRQQHESLQPVDSSHVHTLLTRSASDEDRIDDLRRQTSTAEWHDSIREYETGAEIGEGSFGKVHLWTHRATGRQYACKKMNKLRMDEEDMVILDREIALLRELDHPNIVKLHRVLDTPYKLYLLIDYVPGGDLFQQLQENHASQMMYSEQYVAELVVQILEALAYMHSKNIAHRDLKPDNLLLRKHSSSGDGVVAAPAVILCDFGFARYMDDRELNRSVTPGGSLARDVQSSQPNSVSRETQPAAGDKDGRRAGLSLGSQHHLHLTACGTPHYIAPEVLRSKKGADFGESVPTIIGYDCKCDVWSLGVIFHVLLVGFPPFDIAGDDINQLYRQILHKPIEEDCLAHVAFSAISSQALNLLSHMLIREPALRISSAEALRHGFLQRARVVEDSSLTNTASSMQRVNSYQRLVEFNTVRKKAKMRWSKLRIAFKTVWSFNEQLRKQIDLERRASAAARRYTSYKADEEARLSVELDELQRQKEELFFGDRWKGKPRHGIGCAALDSDQKARAWLQAGEVRKRQAGPELRVDRVM